MFYFLYIWCRNRIVILNFRSFEMKTRLSYFISLLILLVYLHKDWPHSVCVTSRNGSDPSTFQSQRKRMNHATLDALITAKSIPVQDKIDVPESHEFYIFITYFLFIKFYFWELLLVSLFSIHHVQRRTIIEVVTNKQQALMAEMYGRKQ